MFLPNTKLRVLRVLRGEPVVLPVNQAKSFIFTRTKYNGAMRNMNTPDQLPLFVYGTLLSDQPAHNFIVTDIVQSAVASVAGLALYSVGRYPIAVAGAGQVIGEVHWLQSENYAALIQELEAYEGPQYTRTRRLAQLANQSQLAVWIFTGEPAAAQHLPLIANGDWRSWLQQSRHSS